MPGGKSLRAFRFYRLPENLPAALRGAKLAIATRELRAASAILAGVAHRESK